MTGRVFRYSLLVFFLVVLSGVTWALVQPVPKAPLRSAAPECACDPGNPDPYEQPERMEFGVYKGECVETCRFRKSQIRGESDGRLVVTNILHEQRYWTGAIAMNMVEAVDMGFEAFRPGINHTFLRFRFQKDYPVLLSEQGEKREARAVISDLVMSPEAVLPRGREYDFLYSAYNNYLLSFRLLSVREFHDWGILKYGHAVRQYRLKLTPEQRVKVLKTAIDASERDSLGSVYSLLRNNCATSVCRVVDPHAAVNIAQTLPIDFFFSTYSDLDKRGLIDHSAGPLPNLELELKQ